MRGFPPQGQVLFALAFSQGEPKNMSKRAERSYGGDQERFLLVKR